MSPTWPLALIVGIRSQLMTYDLLLELHPARLHSCSHLLATVCQWISSLRVIINSTDSQKWHLCLIAREQSLGMRPAVTLDLWWTMSCHAGLLYGQTAICPPTAAVCVSELTGRPGVYYLFGNIYELMSMIYLRVCLLRNLHIVLSSVCNKRSTRIC